MSIDESKHGSSQIFLGIEVTSPILRRTFTDNDARDMKALETVGKVLDLLKRNFRTTANDTRGLHMHVGDDGDGFPLDTLRKLMAFLNAFEPGIEKLHPLKRRNEQATYCLPVRPNVQPKFTAIGPDAVEFIMSQPTLFDLIGIMDGSAGWVSGRSAYNLVNLLTAFEVNGKLTVEFRQHKGTLGPNEAMLWAKFCAQLVSYVEKESTEDIYKVSRQEMVRLTGRLRGLSVFRMLPRYRLS